MDTTSDTWTYVNISEHPLWLAWKARHAPETVTVYRRPIDEGDIYGEPREFDEYLDLMDQRDRATHAVTVWRIPDIHPAGAAERESWAIGMLLANVDGLARPAFERARDRLLAFGYDPALLDYLPPPPLVPLLHMALPVEQPLRDDWYWTYGLDGLRITRGPISCCGASLYRVKAQSCARDGSGVYGDPYETVVCLTCGYARWTGAAARRIVEVLGEETILPDPDDHEWDIDPESGEGVPGSYRRICLKRAGAMIPASRKAQPIWPDPEVLGGWLTWNPAWVAGTNRERMQT